MCMVVYSYNRNSLIPLNFFWKLDCCCYCARYPHRREKEKRMIVLAVPLSQADAVGDRFFLQLGYSIIETLVIVFSFIGLGILIETVFRRVVPNIPSPSRWNRIFNCKCAAVLTVFHQSIEVILFLPVYWLAFK